MTLAQDADAIIAEENLDDATPAATPDEPANNGDEDDNAPDSGAQPGDKKGDEPVDSGGKPDGTPAADADKPATDADGKTPDKPAEEPKKDDTTADKPATSVDTKSATETVTEAKSLLQNLNLSEETIFDEKGEVKPFRDVVPAGPYLASQLEPVKVTDKDGKEHEFLLLSDVEKAFPNGFEAKNNIEDMRFREAIMRNETNFNKAVTDYKQAETQYNQETSQMVEVRTDINRINTEYRAMADQGLVPKVEGDPKDANFAEQPAVKELDKILTWMNTKNEELAKQGLGKINSVYVAKLLMDQDATKDDKKDKANKIVDERKEVAKLTASDTTDDGKDKKETPQEVPMSRLADQIIEEEGLK